MQSHKTFNDRDSAKHNVVLQRASELVRLLKFPSVASAILDPSHKVLETGESHVDSNSSLPFILQSLSLKAPTHTNTKGFHSFTLQQVQ